MSLERRLLAACLKSRKAWQVIVDAEASSFHSPAYEYLEKMVSQYYTTDENARSVDVHWLRELLATALDSPKKVNEFNNLVDELVASDVSAENIAALVTAKRKKDVGEKLAMALANDSDGIDSLIDRYKSVADKGIEDDSEVLCGFTVEDSIASVLDTSKLLPLPSRALNDILGGGVPPEGHIVIAARPETGKTALCVSVMQCLAAAGKSGIYFGNEDPIRNIILRTQQACSGLARDELVAQPAEANARLRASGFDRIRFIPLNPGTPSQIRKYCRQYKPQWIVVDQIRNLRMNSDTRVNQLEAAATEMRNISKEFSCIVFSVTQAGDSASNKLVLDMGDVDGSNTGIPAQADLMIMLGVNDQFYSQGLRMINLPKNKFSGVHVHFPLKIVKELSTYADVDD